MNIVRNLLSAEASYVKYAESTENLASLQKRERKSQKSKIAQTKEEENVSMLLGYYRQVKRMMIRNPKSNLFF